MKEIDCSHRPCRSAWLILAVATALASTVAYAAWSLSSSNAAENRSPPPADATPAQPTEVASFDHSPTAALAASPEPSPLSIGAYER
jgi:hypothetical protein